MKDLLRRLTFAATFVAAGAVVTTSGAQDRATGEHWIATWGTAQQTYRATQAGRGGPPPSTAAPATAAAGSAPAPAPAPPVVAPPPAPAPSAAPATTPEGRPVPQRRFPVPPALPGVENQTVRMIARTSAGGRVVRVRLAHAYGAPAVTVGAAHIAVRGSGSSIVPATDRTLTFGGQSAVTLYAGQMLVSDPVNLEVKPLTDLAVSLFFPESTGPPTSHTFGLRPAYVSRSGDVTGAPDFDASVVMQSYYWLAGIDVMAPPSAGTLVTFGDSITDGDQSEPDTLGMWPAVLAQRLQASAATRQIGVVNAGISGNRVLGDNGSALARFSRDALAVPGVKWITILEGINDITAATRQPQNFPGFSAKSLIAAYKQMIALAHDRGVRVIGCTITPYAGSSAYTDEGEAIRQEVNSWIRSGGGFDAVVDFDRATRDATDPTRFRAEADSPDMLHPGNAGYKLMAEAIDLSIFKSAPAPRH